MKRENMAHLIYLDDDSKLILTAFFDVRVREICYAAMMTNLFSQPCDVDFDLDAAFAALDETCVATAAQVFHVTFFVPIPVVDQREINPLFLETIVIEKTFAGSIATIFDPAYVLARYPFIVEAQLPDRYNFALKAGERMPKALAEDRKIQKVFASHGFYKWSAEDQEPLREWWNNRKTERLASRDYRDNDDEDDVTFLF
jgi:hypothetical protein